MDRRTFIIIAVIACIVGNTFMPPIPAARDAGKAVGKAIMQGLRLD